MLIMNIAHGKFVNEPVRKRVLIPRVKDNRNGCIIAILIVTKSFNAAKPTNLDGENRTLVREEPAAATDSPH